MTTRDIPKTITYTQAPSGRWYCIWVDGDGAIVRDKDFDTVLADGDALIVNIPLQDTLVVAGLIRRAVRKGRLGTTP